jgi:hypothetical protein
VILEIVIVSIFATVSGNARNRLHRWRSWTWLARNTKTVATMIEFAP